MRYRFVDKIVDLEAGKTIHCQYTWPVGLEIYKDHFPNFPVVPGVLLTEMMGQSASICIQSLYVDFGVPMLIQISNARFRNWVRPGNTLDIYAELQSVQTKLARAKVKTKNEGTSIANVELLFTFEKIDKLGLPAIDPILAKYRDQPDIKSD